MAAAGAAAAGATPGTGVPLPGARVRLQALLRLDRQREVPGDVCRARARRHQVDRETQAAARRLGGSAFTAGNLGGGTPAQLGFAIGTWAVGKASGSARVTAVGADLLSAQIVTQTVVQGLKYSVGRPRPDLSNNRSFPSGHAASSFATAAVLQRHFGWKVGVPAYAFGTYVAAARMTSSKHHLSDVVMGAGIGLVAGRAVTVGVGRQQFDLGVAPTQGGAALTFTRK